MKGTHHTYLILPMLEVPGIPVDLLWDLVRLFGGITGVYFLLIFMFRFRISEKRARVQLRKQELAPMISNFLFFQQDTDVEDREAYIRMKIEIRELLKIQINREVMAEVLMDLRYDVSGEVRERLFRLYQDLGLHMDAFKKLGGWRWDHISRGILELTEMQVKQSYLFIRKHINHRRGIVRKQAQLATVSLREEGIAYFLDTVCHRISEWQQVKLLEILQQREDFDPPRFKRWLISENRDVVLFALRLIRHYRQNDAGTAIITLLHHRCPTIKGAALECIREFGFREASSPLKGLFTQASPELKVQILDALEPIADRKDLEWLREQASRDTSFLVRSKAGAVINSLEPDSVLPTKDILSVAPPLVAREDTASPPPEGERLAVLSDLEGKDGTLQVPIFLNPDFALADSAQNTAKTRAESFLLADLPEALPFEDWSPHREAVFNLCLEQEWTEIRSALHSGIFLEVPPPEFLPLVNDQPSPKYTMEPNETTPDRIRRLEVIADILPADSGYVRMLRELLLEDLEETEAVFHTDFIPLVSEASDAGPSPDREDPGIFPEFEVLADAIELLDPAPEAITGKERAVEADITDGDLPPFCIFNEFFRSYDRESKLILLDEIPEVGGEKELGFLRDLFEDPDPKISQKARKAHGLLSARLGGTPGEPVSRGSRSLWIPKRRAGLRRAKQASAAGLGESPEEIGMPDFGFIPDFTTPPSAKGIPRTREGSPLVEGYHRFKNYFNGTQGISNE